MIINDIMPLREYIINDVKPLKLSQSIRDAQNLFNQLTYYICHLEKAFIQR